MNCISQFLTRSRFSIFYDLPETFEVARYHSLHGIKSEMPPELKVTAMTDDGIVMGIQHASLPFAAVQFHPESILTSPAHGMTILENALKFLKYDEDDASPKSGAEIVGELEKLPLEDLQAQLSSLGLSTVGSKSELVVRLALWTHKGGEVKAGRLVLGELEFEELQEVRQGLGLKTDLSTKEDLVDALENCLQAEK